MVRSAATPDTTAAKPARAETTKRPKKKIKPSATVDHVVPAEAQEPSPPPITPFVRPEHNSPRTRTTAASTAVPASTTVSANQDYPYVLSPHARHPSGIDALCVTFLTDMGSLSGTFNVSPNTPTPNIIDGRSPGNRRRRHAVSPQTKAAAEAGVDELAVSALSKAEETSEVTGVDAAGLSVVSVVSEPPSLSASGSASFGRTRAQPSAVEVSRARRKERVRESRSRASATTEVAVVASSSPHKATASLAETAADKTSKADAPLDAAAGPTEPTESTEKKKKRTDKGDKSHKIGESDPPATSDPPAEAPPAAAARAYEKPWLINASTRHHSPSHTDNADDESHVPDNKRTSSPTKTRKKKAVGEVSGPSRTRAGGRTSTTPVSAADRPRRPRSSDAHQAGEPPAPRARRSDASAGSDTHAAARPTAQSNMSSLMNDSFATRTSAGSRRESGLLARSGEDKATRQTRRGITPTTYSSSPKRRQQQQQKEQQESGLPAPSSRSRQRDVKDTDSVATMNTPPADASMPSLHPTFIHLDSATNNAAGSDLHEHVVQSVSNALYDGIYTDLAVCEEEEVPPLFERPLSYYEQNMIRRHGARVVGHYQNAMIKRKAALKKENSLMPLTMYGGFTGGAPVEDLKHMARVVRYCLEEDNWRTAVESMHAYQILCAKILAPTYRMGDDAAEASPDEKPLAMVEEGGEERDDGRDLSALMEESSASVQFLVEEPSASHSVAAPSLVPPAAQESGAATTSASASVKSGVLSGCKSDETVKASADATRKNKSSNNNSSKGVPSMKPVLATVSVPETSATTTPSTSASAAKAKAKTKKTTTTITATPEDSHGQQVEKKPTSTGVATPSPSRHRRRPRRRGPVSLPNAPLSICPTMQLVSFSRFEVGQELKRMVWWCAAHHLSRFSVAVGVAAGADNLSDMEESSVASRSAVMADCSYNSLPPAMAPSPVLYPAAHPGHHKYREGQHFSVFYDTVVLLLFTDKWLQNRTQLHSRSRIEGLITISLLPCVLKEARSADWAQFQRVGKPRLEGYVRQRLVQADSLPPASVSRPRESSLTAGPSGLVGVDETERLTDMGSPVSRSASPTRSRRRELPTVSALSFFS